MIENSANNDLSLSAQEPRPRPCSTYHFGETTTLSIATCLLRYTHGVPNQLLEWHLLGWEASGKDNPQREVEMHTERAKKVTAGDRVFLPSPRQFIGNMGILGPREQQGVRKRPDSLGGTIQKSIYCSLFALGCAMSRMADG